MHIAQYVYMVKALANKFSELRHCSTESRCVLIPVFRWPGFPPPRWESGGWRGGGNWFFFHRFYLPARRRRELWKLCIACRSEPETIKFCLDCNSAATAVDGPVTVVYGPVAV